MSFVVKKAENQIYEIINKAREKVYNDRRE